MQVTKLAPSRRSKNISSELTPEAMRARALQEAEVAEKQKISGESGQTPGENREVILSDAQKEALRGEDSKKLADAEAALKAVSETTPSETERQTMQTIRIPKQFIPVPSTRGETPPPNRASEVQTATERLTPISAQPAQKQGLFGRLRKLFGGK